MVIAVHAGRVSSRAISVLPTSTHPEEGGEGDDDIIDDFDFDSDIDDLDDDDNITA
jgi:hypothetical protein